ncbi:unnamed protein product [Rotaria sp. Silwood2]|nr:unnamed protein product [Rotaria sp. Silwood2]CAF4331340.1 unnamed protein product [Rotaria sp. Silwood2]CAF4440121.1 unnamed protein product [Rotaria sp. Silwood2]
MLFDMKSLKLLALSIAMIINIIYTFKALRTSEDEKSSKNVYALIVVDIQNCFITGTLALSNSPAHQNGAEVIPIINHLIQTVPFDFIVYTQDWHPPNHISFFENLKARRKYLKSGKKREIKMFDEVTYTGPKVKTKQILWPSHCIRGTEDAALHKHLYISPAKSKVIRIRKGTNPDIDSYSAFMDNERAKKTKLDDKLRERNVTHVFIAGLATDYCVATSALDAFNLKYETSIIEDACRGVDMKTIKSKLDHLKKLGVKVIQANQVKGIIASANCDDIDKTCH